MVELSTSQCSFNWESLNYIGRPLGLSNYEGDGWEAFLTALQEDESMPQHGPILCQVGTPNPSQPRSIAIGYRPSTDPLDTQPDASTYRPSVPTTACWWYELDTKRRCFPCRGPPNWTSVCYHAAQALDEVLLGNTQVGDRPRWAKSRARRYLEKIKGQTWVSVSRK